MLIFHNKKLRNIAFVIGQFEEGKMDMDRSKVNKILKLIDKCESPKITIEYIQDNLKTTRNEIIEIFDALIADKKAREYYTIKEKSIVKIEDVDYSSLKKTNANPKRDIIKIISVTIVVMTFILSVILNWDKILSVFN